MKLLLIEVVFLVLVTSCLITILYLKDLFFMKYSRNRRHLENEIVLMASDKDFVISSHNDVRSNVMPTSDGMRKLTWNDELAETAQEYSRNCVYEHSNEIFTSKFNKIGENLYVRSREAATKKILKEENLKICIVTIMYFTAFSNFGSLLIHALNQMRNRIKSNLSSFSLVIRRSV